MSNFAKWCFTLPLTYVLYFALSILLPQGGLFAACLRYAVIIEVFLVICKKFLSFDIKLFFNKNGEKFSFKRFFCGFFLMAGLLSLLTVVRMLRNPGTFAFTFDISRTYELLLSLVLVVLAALTEELMFRAFIANFKATDNPPVVKTVIISSLLFAIAHFQNPEVVANAVPSMLFYFVFGAVLMLFYLRDRSIEFPLGLHIGNNLVAAWLFTYPSAAVQTNALFTAPQSVAEEFIACALLLGLYLIRPSDR